MIKSSVAIDQSISRTNQIFGSGLANKFEHLLYKFNTTKTLVYFYFFKWGCLSLANKVFIMLVEGKFQNKTKMIWNYFSIPKLQRCNRWSLGMEK